MPDLSCFNSSKKSYRSQGGDVRREENSCLTNSSSGHHLEEETTKVFRLWNGRQHRMIERLFETTQPTRGTASIDQRARDGFSKNFGADVVGTGKGREQSVRRKQ